MTTAVDATRAIDPSLSTLLFLGVVLGLSLLAAGAVFLARAGRVHAAARMALAVLSVAVVYALTVVVVAQTHPGSVLARGEPLTFTGFYLDPHLNLEVTGARLARELGANGARVAAHGRWAIVTVELSSTAVAAIQQPHALDLTLTDDLGRRWTRDLAGEAALAAERGPLGDLNRPIEPHGAYRRDVVFDVPVGTHAPRLLAFEGLWIDRLLEAWIIGDDDAIGHRRTALALGFDVVD
jgi:hypothetical protein